MKITRNMLLIIVASLGAFIIVYSLIRYFTGVGFGEKAEKYMMDVIVISALALFMYNRKLARDEKKAREAAAEAERRAAEEPANAPDEAALQEAVSEDDENLPHWERGKSRGEEEKGAE